MSIWERLASAQADHGDARIAVLGAGFVGRAIVHSLARAPGMRPALIVNRSIERALRAYESAGWDRDAVVISEDPPALAAAIERYRPAVTRSPPAALEAAGADLLVEATGTLDYAARAVVSCLEAGRDVVSMNAELDATVGLLLHDLARRHGAVYTIADGDQPGALLRQTEFVTGLGFEVGAAVNCKRNLDVHQSPDASGAYASRDGTSLPMTTAFGDGTKMNMENAVVANAIGLVPDRRGMHGVRTTVERAAEDIMSTVSRPGVVEFTLGGDFGAGIGVVARSPEPEVDGPYMRYLKMGEGPWYFFFRPYHLVHLEVPRGIAEVLLDRRPLGRVEGPPVAEVVAIAKRDLRRGETIDGIGGSACYGQIDTTEGAAGLLPIGIAHHARLLRPIARDHPVPLDAVELDRAAEIVALRARQDESLRSRRNDR